MTYAAIQEALEAKLAGLGSITVAWPGVVFDPPSSGIWYKPTMLPGGVDPEFGAGAATHPNGDFQVSVFAKPGSGTSALMAAVDALVAHFDRVSLSSNSLHCGVPEPGPLLTEPNWLHVPVTIPFTVL